MSYEHTLIALPQRLSELPLGRHVEHDPRSRGYAFQQTRAAVQSVRHQRSAPALNQGDVGACTGYAMVHALSCAPFAATLPGRRFDDALARELYSAATQRDSIAGAWPPQDTGSTALGIAKATKDAGLISGYTHAFSTEAALQALQLQPILIGSYWYDSMDRLISGGIATIAPGARRMGGHQYFAYGIDAPARQVLCGNSWGPTWGIRGDFRLTFNDFDRLLREQGDVLIPVPLNVAAPTPVASGPVVSPIPAPAPAPVPTVSPADAALAKAMRQWLADNKL